MALQKKRVLLSALILCTSISAYPDDSSRLWSFLGGGILGYITHTHSIAQFQFSPQFLSVLQNTFNDTIAMPSEYQQFQSMGLTHLKSACQQGPACGWYAVCNAVAINMVSKNNGVFNAKAIASEVELRLIPNVKRHKQEIQEALQCDTFLEGLPYQQIYAFAEYMKLEHYFIVNVHPEFQWFKVYNPSMPEKYESFFTKINDHEYASAMPHSFIKQALAYPIKHEHPVTHRKNRSRIFS